MADRAKTGLTAAQLSSHSAWLGELASADVADERVWVAAEQAIANVDDARLLEAVQWVADVAWGSIP